MEFDIESFGSQFQNTIDWMLQGEHRDIIKKHLDNCLRRKNELEANPESLDALRFLVTLKITNSWFRDPPDDFGDKFRSFEKQYGEDFRTEEAQERLANLIAECGVLRIPEEKAREWVRELLNNSGTLSDFTRALYNLRKKGVKAKELGLGNKGADVYLRNFGKWDRIPIDIHEKRFLLRSGIYHAFSISGNQDPLQDRCLQDALSEFCRQCLQGKIVEGIDLASAPGIVDVFIWSYCADNKSGGYNICGSAPRCGVECSLTNSCLFGTCKHARQMLTNGQEG